MTTEPFPWQTEIEASGTVDSGLPLWPDPAFGPYVLDLNDQFAKATEVEWPGSVST